MDIQNTLRELITTGESLAPKGGDALYYNGDLQPEYVSWRLQAISAIQDLGQAAKPILKDLDSDEQGPYFFKSTAQRVLGGLRAALAIAEKQRLRNDKQSTFTIDADATSNLKVFIVHG